MIYSITGELVHVQSMLAVVETGGIAYSCKTTMSTLSKIGEVGSKVTLYTYLHVREDAMELYGFSSMSEKDCFMLLISVSGVGPKAALSILSDTTPENFALCVATGDFKTLTRSQGIGAKIAQRIVLELKDKVSKQNADLVSDSDGFAADIKGSNLGEAVSALAVLGYSKSEATQALSGLAADTEVEELIKFGLKKLASGR